MSKSAEMNLTVGSPGKVILRFCIPILLTNLLQNLYSTIDTIVIGQFLGKEALAGSGSTGAVNFLVIGFCMGLCMGFAIPVAQFFGAGDLSSLRRTYANSIWASVVSAILITITVCIFCRQILILMQTPDSVIDMAYNYIFIIFAGIPITIAYNLLSGIIRALGDSRSPLYFLMAASIVNIGFDILSVTVLHMGVQGPALATLLAQLFSALLCVLHIRKHFSILHIEDRSEWRPDSSYLYLLCSMGIPMGLQFSITAIGSVILQAGVNTLGADSIAAVSAATRFILFVESPLDSMGAAMSTYAGQNIGAREVDRVGQGLRAACILGFIYSVASFVVMLFAVRYCMLLFIKPEETLALTQASQYCLISVLFFPLLVIVNTFRSTIQGIGHSSFAMIAGIMEMIARSLVGFWLIPAFGFLVSCFSSPIAWVFADVFLIPAYFYVMKKARVTSLLHRN